MRSEKCGPFLFWLFLVVVLAILGIASAAHESSQAGEPIPLSNHPIAPTVTQGERWHAKELAAKFNAEIEVVLYDDSRVDLLSETHAFEIDWAPKHAEAIGQAVHYSLITDRKPGVILLLTDPATEWRHLVRAARVCGHLGIELHVEKVD